jgi:hypothetical protein
MTYGSVYSGSASRTVTLTAGSTTVQFSGTLLVEAQLRAEDTFQHAGLMLAIASITDDDTLELALPWPGSNVTASTAWRIVRDAPSRLDQVEAASAMTQAYGFASLINGQTRAFAVESESNTPPGSPVTGRHYLAGASPSGWAIAVAAGDIVKKTGSGWATITPEDGWLVVIKATGTLKRFGSGAWSVPLAAGSVALSMLESVSEGAFLARSAAGTGTIEKLTTAQARALLKVREQTGAITFYVNGSTGSDSNDGLSTGTAVATIQKAIDLAYSIDTKGANATIRVADGTYTAGGVATGALPGGGRLVLVGNEVTPANVKVTCSASDCFRFAGGRHFIYGFQLKTTGAYSLMRVTFDAYVEYSLMIFDDSGESYVSTESGAISFHFGSSTMIGDAVSAFHTTGGATTVTIGTFSLTGTPAFSAYFAGNAGFGSASFGGATFTGAATGKKFLAHNWGVIDVGSQDRNFLPGNIAGEASEMGSYVGSETIIGLIKGNDVGHKNLLINPFGRVNQRNIGAGALTDGSYGVDRWIGLSQSNPITMGSTAGPTPMIRLTQANASAQRMGASQQIEANDSRWLRGEKVSLSGKVQISASQRVNWAILEWTGSGNVAIRDVVNDWTNATLTPGNFFVSSNYNVLATGNLTPAANTLTDIPSLTATVGSSMNNLVVVIWTDQTAAQNVTLDFALQLERGPQATALEHRPLEDELSACMRFYQSIDGTGLLGQVTSATGAYIVHKFPVRMRATPTITLVKTAWAAASFEILINALWVSNASASISGTTVTTQGFNTILGGFSGLTAGTLAQINTNVEVFTASAEIGA